jgi:hypothetical protein
MQMFRYARRGAVTPITSPGASLGGKRTLMDKSFSEHIEFHNP